MTSLLEQSVAQSKEYKSLIQNLMQLNSFLIGLDLTSLEYESTKIRPTFLKQIIAKSEVIKTFY